jgi:hypothetical protein
VVEKKSLLEIANFPCPHCGFVDTHQVLEAKDSKPYEYLREIVKDQTYDQFRQSHLLTRCARCERETYRLVEDGPVRIFFGRVGMTGRAPDRSKSERRVVFQYPVGTGTTSGHVPAAVSIAMIEAEKCFAVGAHNACGTMARRAADALAQQQNAKGGNVYERLKDLLDKGTITRSLYDWAEELRVAGKLGAHPEWRELDQEQARYALELMRELVKHVYVLPGELAARRLKGSEKKKNL